MFDGVIAAVTGQPQDTAEAILETFTGNRAISKAKAAYAERERKAIEINRERASALYGDTQSDPEQEALLARAKYDLEKAAAAARTEIAPRLQTLRRQQGKELHRALRAVQEAQARIEETEGVARKCGVVLSPRSVLFDPDLTLTRDSRLRHWCAVAQSAGVELE